MYMKIIEIGVQTNIPENINVSKYSFCEDFICSSRWSWKHAQFYAVHSSSLHTSQIMVHDCTLIIWTPA